MTIRTLKRRALKLGGSRFQVPWVLVRDVSDLLPRPGWTVFDGTRTRLVKSSKGLRMEVSQCHTNAAALAIQRGWELWSGLALSDDGVWRCHSWVRIPSTGTIAETTELRTIYYGVRMDPEEIQI